MERTRHHTGLNGQGNRMTFIFKHPRKSALSKNGKIVWRKIFCTLILAT